MSDDELLAEARKFEKNLLNFFWRQGVQYSEGEDLVQETYLRLWKYRREYKPAPSVGSADAREDVRWAVAQLSEPHREVVELGVFQDLPYAEVAEILGIPVGTVKSRMSNALKKLKEVFDERRS